MEILYSEEPGLHGHRAARLYRVRWGFVAVLGYRGKGTSRLCRNSDAKLAFHSGRSTAAPLLLPARRL